MPKYKITITDENGYPVIQGEATHLSWTSLADAPGKLSLDIRGYGQMCDQSIKYVDRDKSCGSKQLGSKPGDIKIIGTPKVFFEHYIPPTEVISINHLPAPKHYSAVRRVTSKICRCSAKDLFSMGHNPDCPEKK